MTWKVCGGGGSSSSGHSGKHAELGVESGVHGGSRSSGGGSA